MTIKKIHLCGWKKNEPDELSGDERLNHVRFRCPMQAALVEVVDGESSRSDKIGASDPCGGGLVISFCKAGAIL